jgi:hypothetical protein
MKRWISFIGAALMSVCPSCFTGTGSGDEDQPDRTTVLGTLNLFLDVWNSGDIVTYEDLLDGKDFTFYFDPADVGGDVPSFWGYDEEIEAYANLFAALGGGNVSAWLDLSGVTEPEGGADTCTVEGVPYLVLFNAGPDSYRAEARFDMTLAKSGGRWFITEWWDRVTWGAVKAMYGGGSDG